jgi:predicted phosphodiesterase
VISFKIAVVSDTHLGSRFAHINALHAFYRYASEVGCDLALHTGDLIDGVQTQRGHTRETTSPDHLLDYVAAVYPSELPTFFISGNHEDRLLYERGVDFGTEICKLRSDMHYMGMNEALFTHKGRNFFLYHGNGQSSTQGHVKRAYSLGSRYSSNLDVLICGHMHIYRLHSINTSLGVVCPCFQLQPPYLITRNVIGGVILSVDNYINAELRPF